MFSATAWFRGSSWDGLIGTVLRLERTICKRDPKTGLCKQTCESVFRASSAAVLTPELWNETTSAQWRIENGSHYVRETTFVEDASRIRKKLEIAARLRSFAYNLIRAGGCSNICNERICNERWRAALDINSILEFASAC